MKPLTDLEREELMHRYDPVKAHEYYLRIRQLKGRKPGEVQVTPQHTKKQAAVNTKAHQRKVLAAAIKNLQAKLQKLEALIKQREQEEASTNRKSKAKKERAAKEHTKPKTAADKAKVNRENKKYREAHKQSLKTKAKQTRAKSTTKGVTGNTLGSHTKSSPRVPRNASDGVAPAAHKHSLSELKSLATKVRGQIQVAQQKLAAL